MQDQTPQKKNSRVVRILIAVIIVLAVLAFYVHSKKKPTEQAPSPEPIATPTTMQPTENSTETLLPAPKVISPFTLTDDTGKPLTNDNLKGHWSFVFFGFTHCGDVCPTTLTELNKMYQQLQQKNLPSDALPQIIFVSVDPERDTVEALHNYIKNYNPNFIAATGDASNLNVFVKDMGVYFNKVPGEDANNYGVHHSSQLYVFNPEGNWVGISNYPSQADQLAKNYETMTQKPA